MAEKLCAKLLQKKILGFKVSVEGGSADVRALNYFTDGYLRNFFLGEQLCKSSEDCLAGFSLPSVHNSSIHFYDFVRFRTFARVCILFFMMNKIK